MIELSGFICYKKNQLIFLAFFFLFSFIPAGQDILIEEFGSREVIPLAFQTLQDNKGYLWIATVGGLFRSNGRELIHHAFVRDDPYCLSSSDVRVLLEDSSGRLWVGTYTGGLNLYQAPQNSWLHYRAEAKINEGLQSDTVLALCEDRDGAIWIGTWGGGVNRFDPRLEKWNHYGHDPDDENTLSNNNVSSIIEDKNGIIWVGTQRGLNRFDPETVTWKRYLKKDQTADQSACDIITCLREDPGGYIWVGTFNGGLNRLNPQDGNWRGYSQKKAETITAIFIDRPDRFLIGTSSGVWGFSPYSGKWTDPEKLKLSGMIESIDRDFSGNIWISGTPDLRRVNPWKSQWRTVVLKEQGIDSFIDCLCLHPEQGIMLVIEGRIWRFDSEKNALFPFTAMPDPPPLDSVITGILCDSEGWFWLGTANAGILHRQPWGDQWIHHNAEEEAGGLLSAQIVSLAEDKHGVVWAITGLGLARYNRNSGNWKHYRHQPDDSNSLSSDNTTSLLLSLDQHVWVGTENGLNQYDPGNDQWTRYTLDPRNANTIGNNYITSLFEDSRGIIWAGTIMGLFGYDRSARQWQELKSHASLAKRISAVLEDRHGYLWISTPTGIVRHHPVSGESRFLDQENAFFVTRTSFNRSGIDPLGRLIMADEQGFVIIDPERLSFNLNPPKTVIEGIIPADASPERLQALKAMILSGALTLTHKENSFSLHFAALDFTDPDKNHCHFRLDPFDPDWREAGDKNKVEYTNIPPGEYFFWVKGCNSDGIWDEIGARLRIVIVPAIWQTLWFRLFLFLGLVSAFCFLIFFLRRNSPLPYFWRWKRARHIGAYQLEKVVGQGGMATVYQAHSLLNRQKKVAIKVLRDEIATDPLTRRRFLQEGSLIDILHHPNIVRIFERSIKDNEIYIVMEYLEGVTLKKKLEEQGRLDVSSWLNIMRQLVEVLVKIHAQGVIHRDLKPANIMLLNQDENPLFVKVLDFGVARHNYQSTLTEMGNLLGTIQYMAPEQILRSEYLSAGDIYSCAVMSYEMLTGVRPFPEENIMETIGYITAGTPRSMRSLIREIPGKVENLVSLMLVSDPGQRPDARELSIILQELELNGDN